MINSKNMENRLLIILYITLSGLSGCQNHSNNDFMKNIITVNFNEITTVDNSIIKNKNKISLLVHNDTIQTFIYFNKDTVELPRYRISFKNDSIFVENSKKKILLFTTTKNDTIKFLDIGTLNDELSTFVGLSTYLKDSTINILGCERECYVFKQMRGEHINNRYSTHQIVFIDKKRLILLKQEDTFFDMLKNQDSHEKIELKLSSLL